MTLKSCSCATESCATVLNSSSLPQYQYRVTCSFNAGTEDEDEGNDEDNADNEELGLIPYFLSCANTDLVALVVAALVVVVLVVVAFVVVALVVAALVAVLASSFRMSM